MTEQPEQQIPYPEQVRLLRRIMDATVSGGYTVVLDGDGGNRAWLRLSSPDRPRQRTTIEVAHQGERVVARWVHAKGRTVIAEARRTDLIVASVHRCLGGTP